MVKKAKQAVPDATESQKLRSDLWDQPVECLTEAHDYSVSLSKHSGWCQEEPTWL